MASRDFTLSVAVPVSPREAIDHQVDMPRHLGLHPYLTAIDLVGRGVEGGCEWAEYVVLEHPRFFRLRYPIKFPVRVVRRSPTAYDAHVSAAPGCTMLIEAHAVEDPDQPGGAVLTEHVTVSAPRIFLGYMTRQAETAHAATYAVLPDFIAEKDRRPRS